MKRILAIFAIVALLLPLFAMGLEAEGHPTSVALKWGEVGGAEFYDIYRDNGFVVRLPSTGREYMDEKVPKGPYSYSIAARDKDGKDIDAAWANASTSGWDGTYVYKCLSGKDNDGMASILTLRVTTKNHPSVGQYMQIEMKGAKDNDFFRAFPLFDPESGSIAGSGEWLKYKGDGNAETSYRRNAAIFNTSSMSPSKFKVTKIVIDYDSITANLQTKALAFTFDTESSYIFKEDESGNKTIEFSTEGSGLAGKYLLRNTNPGEGDAFIFREVK